MVCKPSMNDLHIPSSDVQQEVKQVLTEIFEKNGESSLGN